ncbi:MAG: sigma-70 family RNA polymerase sigma factor [Clostridia bacterium]|nr:sigma-70 family RNA polymerase sigma factor [Clostridia bacterium]
MTDHNNLSELLAQVKNGNQKAYAELSRQYAPMLYSECSRRSDRMDSDELYQLALIALYGAARTYDEGRGDITFGLYAKICVRRRLDGELRRAGSYLADEPIDENEASPLASPEDELIAREDYRELLDSIDRALTPSERDAFALYLEGRSYAEIADRLGRSTKSVDGALRRAKDKIRKISGGR